MTVDPEVLADLMEGLGTLPRLGGWVAEAACRGEAELFTAFPGSTTAGEKVARICDGCPVRSTCRDYADRYEVDGVWAGSWYDSTGGSVTAPVTRSSRVTVECGTYAGYRKHRRRQEDACGPCRAANTEHVQQYKAARALQ